MASFLLVTTTVAQRAQAIEIGQVLIQKQLAACVQIDGPVTSVYRWDGAIETSDEWRCVAKVPASRFEQVAEEIRQRHPYDVPEIIGTPITNASQPYADWMAAETATGAEPDHPSRGDE